MNICTNEIDELLRRHTATERVTIGDHTTACAIQAAASTPDTDLYRGAFGTVDLESRNARPVHRHTPFDIASITKPLVGATLTMQAVDEARLHWKTPIAEFIPRWADNPHPEADSATILHLLNHTSGLPDWRKFYLDHPLDPSPSQARKTRRAVLDTIIATPLQARPGTSHTYSDLGFILLAKILEIAFDDTPLDRLANERIFTPLKLEHTGYAGDTASNPPVDFAAATEECERRGRVVRGTVHDRNTNVIGGVSAHAGVFSTADELLRFGLHLLAIDRGDDIAQPLVSASTLDFAWSEAAGCAAGHHLAGWDTPSGQRSQAGRGFHRNHTVGHLGFTGTSIWIDRHHQIVSVLLTNRTYPDRDNERISGLRIAFQESILPPDDRPPS